MSDYRDGHSSSRDYDRRYDPRPPLPTRDMMGGRIYIGKLPSDIREREIEKVFGKFGKITEIALKGNYSFVQYQSSRGAKDAVYEMNDRTAFGDRIQVEHARTPKEFGFKAPRGGFGGGGYRSYGGGGGGRGYNSYRGSHRSRRSPPMRSDYRLSVTNLSTRCDGQDLKAVMEKAGEVVYADAHRRRLGEGVVEFVSRKDMERALKKLDGLEINGKPIKLDVEEVRRARHSRSPSRSRSRSKSRSRSRSGTPRNRHSSSRSVSNDRSDDDQSVKSKDGKSDDEEFEEAERSVKLRKQEKGSESDSDHEYEGAEENISQDNERQGSGSPSTHNNDNNDDDVVKSGDDEDVEEVEEIVEEVVEEEVEVDDDESQSDEYQGRNEEQCDTNVESEGAMMINGQNAADY